MSKTNEFDNFIFTIPIDETYLNNKNHQIHKKCLNNDINYNNCLDNMNYNLNHFIEVENLNFKNQDFKYNLNLSNEENKENNNQNYNNKTIKFTEVNLKHNWKSKIRKFINKSKIKYIKNFI